MNHIRIYSILAAFIISKAKRGVININNIKILKMRFMLISFREFIADPLSLDAVRTSLNSNVLITAKPKYINGPDRSL